ncbi:hypothetical protein WAI453_005645 [Rhynchosporium graminicola]|uniref:Cyanovirin-N domain-containing protein n=1 Tax=Rhynchosporium graminicola TaxID=2792576 RepID=A0A1E1LF64_9HELO|nr:uncharacterized protein RCO7_04049 [Rhynchosporium commune]
MQISIQALSKLLVFLLTQPAFGALIPKPVTHPACTDLTWDENDSGFQARICTMPRPSSFRGATQSSLAKRTNEELDNKFASILSALTPNATESSLDICLPASNTPIASENNEDGAQQVDEESEHNDSDTNIERRNTCAGGATPSRLPYRTPLIEIEATASKSWCFRPGPSPNKDHIDSLCRSISQLHYPGGRTRPNIPFQDDFIVQRARGPAISGNTTVENGGSCVCVAGRERTAGFKVCNCDRCDSLVINHGLGDMCKSLQNQCTGKGFSSGYIKSAFKGAMSNSIISLFTFPDTKGGKNQHVELDPVLAEPGAVVSSCRSGDEGRKRQDYSGPVIDCRRAFIPKFAMGRYCRDMAAGGAKVWVKDKEDPFKVLRGKPKGGFSQFGEK